MFSRVSLKRIFGERQHLIFWNSPSNDKICVKCYSNLNKLYPSCHLTLTPSWTFSSNQRAYHVKESVATLSWWDEFTKDLISSIMLLIVNLNWKNHWLETEKLFKKSISHNFHSGILFVWETRNQGEESLKSRGYLTLFRNVSRSKWAQIYGILMRPKLAAVSNN